MSAVDVRIQVKEFKEKHAYGEEPADCFAPWYLSTVFGLSPTEAIRRSAESKQGLNGPGFDFNIDAFHVIQEDSKAHTLILIQAKYSDSLNYVARGVRDFKKGLEWLSTALQTSETEAPRENKVLVNLRAELSNLSRDERDKLKLDFLVIHLNENDIDVINNRTRDAQDTLRDEIRDGLPDHVFKIRLEGPRAIQNSPPPEIAPSPIQKIQFDGTSLSVHDQRNASMYQGIGLLAELVELYRMRKEDLFSKNVRLFLSSKKNVERGPSSKIRESLKSICVDKDKPVPPEIFAFYHNGITIHARDVKLVDGGITFRDPYVLNGCQTVTTAYRFRYGQKASSQVDLERWGRVAVPIRVIDTKDESLVRTVTVSNNRQNAISAAALRANDPLQIDLEHRLAEIGIFYERQEGAYEFLEDTDPDRLYRVYANSEYGPINIEDIARCLAASAGEISVAMNATDLFESDAAYNRCFSQKRVASIHLVTFMQNVHNVLTVVLKNDLGLDWTTSHVKTGKLGYFVFCLFMRYLAKEKLFRMVEDYARALWARDRTLRDEVAKQLDNRHSGIKGAVRDRFMTLQSTKMEGINNAFQRMEASLRLGGNIDVFELFQDFDDRFEK